MKKNLKHAWAVINKKSDEDAPNELYAYGNGDEFQYPIFSSKGDAKSFKGRNYNDKKVKVVRCMITIFD